jgi:ATP-binding protein involved in chromosome partitioning
MIQNMSTFLCPHCSQTTSIFGDRGVLDHCAQNDIPFLGDIPLHASICEDADRGKPTVVAEPDSDRAKRFLEVAKLVGNVVGL